MQKLLRIYAIVFILIVSADIAQAQIASGGSFTLQQSVIANGGSQSSGGGFAVEGTAGQSLTEQSSNSGFQLNSGFWQSSFAPTAASAEISGRVIASNGRGIRNARISITDGSGLTQIRLSSTFGYFKFSEIPIGQTYLITVNSKRFTFAVPTQAIYVGDNINDIEFVAFPQ